MVHRLTDGAYIPLQLKGRTHLFRGEVQIVVPEAGLVDDSALIIAGQLTPSGLGPNLLVISEGEFKRLASFDARLRLWSMALPMHPPVASRSVWAPFVVPASSLGQRLLGASPATFEWPFDLGEAPTRRRDDARLGFLGEQELIRLLAVSQMFDIFRPFPDWEMVEVLLRSATSKRFIGLQVKTTSWPATGPQAHAVIRTRTFRASPTTYVLVLTWLPAEQHFAESCLLVPSEAVPSVAMLDGEFWLIEYRPDRVRRTRLDPYRLPLSALPKRIDELTSS